MKELSLFSGAGGGLLGTKLLGWTHCGYVEYDDYCQRIIKQRIKDGILNRAPIFGDIRKFISEGYADAYQGMVDVVTAGFPCQPFSFAGKRAGQDDSRNMWPQTIDVIRRVRPQFALLENVSGLLAHKYSQQIFRDLAESGYSARWRVLSAAECGAPHKRDRLWIYCHANCDSQSAQPVNDEAPRMSGNVANADSYGKSMRTDDGRRDRNLRRQDSETTKTDRKEQRINGFGKGGEDRNVADSDQVRSSVSPKIGKLARNRFGESSWWEIEPDVGRVADGMASRVDRLKALGNGQVPAVVRAAWELLQ